MSYLESALPLWVFGFIQFAGLLSAWTARVAEGSRGQAWSQRVFIAFLALMGLVTVLSVPCGPRYWFAACGTLGAMMLAAIWHVESPVHRHEIE